MDELKSCHCGGSATLWTAPFGDYIKCNKCGEAVTFLDFDDEKLKSAWNRRPALENKPLTLEQLRKMNCDWVWIERIGKCGELPKSVLKYINGYGYVLGKHQKVKICDICLLFEEYGKTWLAYARKPEQEGQK
jgi:hypothetical protein